MPIFEGVWLVAAVLLLAALALVYLVAAQWFGQREGAADARLFTRFGAEDRFRGTFHRQRFLWRVLALVLGAAVAASPLLLLRVGTWYPMLFICLLYWGAAVWNCEFTVSLNTGRNLSYVDEYYVSQSPTAARWDRMICELAAYLEIPQPSAVHESVLHWSVRLGAIGWISSFLLFILHLLTR